ncbi:MAG TPA: hypothetical protein P5572_16430, partial [Phycisphaerae bacterium]|nr:hypothetical protein [Phycisphaerae bacterium]
DLCEPGNSGCITIPVDAGTTGTAHCVARFDATELATFVGLDDARPACCTGQPGCSSPGDGCYLNCASATAEPNAAYLAAQGICDSAPPIVTSSYAELCTEHCDVAVTKQVRCLPECTDVGMDPEAGWVSSPDELDVLPGACLQYRIKTTNISSTGVEICALRLADDVADSNAFISGPTNVAQSGPVACTSLAPFNWDGAPWECTLTQPGNPGVKRPLLPGEMHTITYRAQVSPNADPAIDPVNTISVGGASFCETTAPLFFDCEATDAVGINIRACGLDVTKDVTCDDPAGPNPMFEIDDVAEAVPGAKVGFSMLVCNTGELNLSSVHLTDTLSCLDWFVPNSVSATIGATDVTSCICPGGNCPDLASLNGTKDLTACIPGGISTNACLTVNFEVQVPTDFSAVGTALDCENTFRAAGFSDVCTAADATTCGVDIDTAGIDVRIPSSECEKVVCADLNTNGVCDEGFTTDLELPCDVTFPLHLIYRGSVTNTGETALSSVRVCDDDLVTNALAAGLTVGPCDLCSGACDGAVDTCAAPVDLDINSTAVATCTIVVPNRQAWENFSGRDGDNNTDCYSNGMRTTGSVPTDDYCTRDSDIPVNSTCSANVCIAPPCAIEVTKGVRCVDGCITRSVVGSPHFADSPPGDFDGNGVMDLRDFVHMLDCLGGPQQMPDPRDANMTQQACIAAFDIDGDHDVDVQDCAMFEALGSQPVDSLAVTPGASVEFEVKVTNVGDQPICSLRFSDILTGEADLCPFPVTSLEHVASNGTSTVCVPPPAWFTADGAPFSLLIPAACSGLSLEPGDMLIVHVGATVSDTATGIVRNDVCVNCSPDDGTGCTAPPAYCGDEACDNAMVPVQECDYTVSKEVACGEPRDDTGAVNTNALFAAEVKSLPGSSNGFLITVCNTGDAELSTIGISDALTCSDWYVPGSVRATVGGVDVTGCVCPPGGCATISDINGDHGLDACLGHGLSADECLAITFEVVPPSCPVPNLDVDCTNIVTVTGHTELCSPDNNPCGPPQTAVATVDVRCPGIACDKCVCADVDTNGSCNDAGDFAFVCGQRLELPCEINFPFDLIYEFRVANTGDTPLTNVQVCDADLLADAGSAGLLPVSCMGCSTPIDLPTNGTASAQCTIRVPNRAAWLAFAQTPDGCYMNEAEASGDADPDFVCTEDVDPRVSSTCSTEVCLEPMCRLDITCPDDVEYECLACTTPDCTGEPTFNTDCDVYSTGFRDVRVPGDCPQEYKILRTWYATAECNVYDECIQTIGVKDTTPPVIDTCPGDIQIDCDEDVPPCDTNAIVAIDSCGAVHVTCRDLGTTGVCPTEIERKYFVSDDCGNVSTCGQTITIVDTNGPMITCPPDVRFECVVGSTGVPTVLDACDPNPLVTFTDMSTNSCPRVITRTWNAVDNCGNPNSCQQIITVDDRIPPVIESCPGDIRIECDEPVPPCDTNGVIAYDACGPVEITCHDSGATGTCPAIIEREYVVTDACGNVSTCGHRIYIDDTEPPVIDTCGPVIHIDCTEQVPACDTSGLVAHDNCDDDLDITCIGDSSDGGTCPETITRKYRVMDDCGNVSTCGRLIVRDDTTPPVITCPPDITFECLAGSSGFATARDDCDPNPDITYTDVTTNSCPTETLRTWKAVDDCGNADFCVQRIKVDDTVPPFFTNCP